VIIENAGGESPAAPQNLERTLKRSLVWGARYSRPAARLGAREGEREKKREKEKERERGDLGASWGLWGGLWTLVGRLGLLLGPPGRLSGATWVPLGGFGKVFGPSCGDFSSSRGPPGASWVPFGGQRGGSIFEEKLEKPNRKINACFFPYVFCKTAKTSTVLGPWPKRGGRGHSTGGPWGPFGACRPKFHSGSRLSPKNTKNRNRETKTCLFLHVFGKRRTRVQFWAPDRIGVVWGGLGPSLGRPWEASGAKKLS